MSYRLNLETTLSEAVRDVALEQIDRALADLREQTDLKAGAHDARKCCKKLRALLRLVRPALKDKIYKRENAAFRDISRELSPIRDAEVFVETIDALAETEGDLPREALGDLRASLAGRCLATTNLLTQDGAIDQAITNLEAARERTTQWVPAVTEQAIMAGLQKIYRQGYKRYQEALEDPTAERLHEWRKSVKYLWYQTRLLGNIWSDLMAATADLQHDLSSLLGSDHDLSELYDFVREEPTICPDKKLRQMLLTRLSEERDSLQAQVWPIAGRVYAEEPDSFTERLGSYWQTATQSAT